MKALRGKLRLTQSELAALVGVSRPTVSAWEQADSDKALVNLAALNSLESGTPTKALPPADLSAELRGRALEVSALLAFALERQNLLAAALGAPADLPIEAGAVSRSGPAVAPAPGPAVRPLRRGKR